MSNLQYENVFVPMLGKYEIDILHSQLQMLEMDVIKKLWNKDFTLWNDSPNEILNRLDWLEIHETIKNEVESINSFTEEIKKDGYKNVLLLGMGGSSLAPEVFRKTFGVRQDYLDLEICDSTHPDFIKSKMEKFDPEKTLYVVSTKSGGTIETISFMKHFYNYVSNKLGEVEVKKHFIAITDPGSGLQEMAIKLGFRKIFLNNPNIGGRFSALSLFGLVPASLLGINLNNLLERVDAIVKDSKIFSVSDIDKNTSASLGLILGGMANKNVNKLTLFMSEQLKSFGSWAEQLVAESTGKIGKGILPVDGEKLLDVSLYSNDRIFVFILLKGDNSYDDKIAELRNAKFPIVKIMINDIYDLGAEFFRWEFATAIAGWIMKLHPFDQPNVESAKIVARQLISEYKNNGKLPEINPSISEDDFDFIGHAEADDVGNSLIHFIKNNISDGSYIAIQAFVNPTEEVENKLQNLRNILSEKYKVATTLGFGPRFLHSTGQLHKGDNGKGIFIQFISEIENDIPIPENAGQSESNFSFGVLITAQAFGDRKALEDNKRKVVTIKLKKDLVQSLKKIKSYFE